MIVHVRGRELTFPYNCACCFAPADTRLRLFTTQLRGVRGRHVETGTWEIPYCTLCSSHSTDFANAHHEFAFFVPLGAILGLVLFVALASSAPAIGLLLGCIPALGGLFARQHFRSEKKKEASARCTPGCCGPGQGARFVGWDGSTQTFELFNRLFAAEFLVKNEKKLVNLNHDGHQLLSWKHGQLRAAWEAEEARLRPQREAAAAAEYARRAEQERFAMAEAEKEAFNNALSKLEAARGPAARRNAIDKAFKTIQNPMMRMRLLTEAAQALVNVALEKAESMKSTAARRNALQSALDELLADDVPDELQQQQLSALQAALNELDAENSMVSRG